MIETRPEGETLVDRAAHAFSAYRDGDRAALDELVGLLTPLLWHTVRGQGVDPVAAEDVVQTIWMRLLHSAASIRDPQTVTKWLLTAARREAWRVTKRSRADLLKTAALFGQEGEELAAIPAQREQLPEEVVFRDDRERQLWTHVRDLPERCRELMRVIAFADRPDYALIAESLGMPVGSIGPTRGRCLAKLRLALASDPQWEGSES
jgi:RNA polymerase sigma factor (sigma-70 family)